MFSAKASTLSTLQVVIAIIALIGLLYVPISLTSIAIAIGFFYAYSILGTGIMLHRYYTHKSFEFAFTPIKWICTLIAIVSFRGSPIGWTYIHRMHHRFSDTPQDPHSPHNLGLKLFFIKDIEPHSSKMNIFMIKDLMTKEQLFINKYYFLIVLLWGVLLALISPYLLYFAWILPVTAVHFSQAAFNYFAHMHGYKSNESKDMSANNIFLWPFIMGDAWHNNHHTSAGSFTTKQKAWEIDPAAWFIKAVRK